MERNVQRINGNVEHLHTWTQEELQHALGYAVIRAGNAVEDVQKIMLEMMNQGMIPTLPENLDQDRQD